MRLEPGYHVSPHVRLVRLLRKGGMGSVWSADHLALRTQVAVKFMSAALAEDESMVTRFTREAAFAAQIKSPHVVQVHDHGMTEDGIHYIVMELLEGEDLAERVQRLGPLPLDDIGQILGQICRALHRAHQIGVVHRDIKLNNVFLVEGDGDIFVKLLDFGIAKQEGNGSTDVTTTGAMVGTLAYMSPEQLHNAKQVDFRTDLWSLAVVVYRTLTGRHPFRDDDGIGALLFAVNSGAFVPPTELRPEAPPAIDAWFLRALARDPEERFASAREMSLAFDIAIGRETTIVPVSRPGGALPRGEPERGGALLPESTNGSVAHARTIAGTGDTSAAKPRSLARIGLAGLAAGVLAALSLVFLRGGGLDGVMPALEALTGEPARAPAVQPAVAAIEPVEPEIAAPAPSGSAAPEPTAAASAEPAPVASASAQPAQTQAAAAGKPAPAKGSPPGTRRPAKPTEKDYGF